MNKIKKQFKDFWQYFRLVHFGIHTAEYMKRFRKCLPAFIIMVIGFVSTFSQMGVSFTFLSGVLVGSAIGLGMCTAVKPTALSVAPFSPKQRMVFTFLSSLLIALFISFFYLSIMLVVYSIIALIAFCVSGENLFAFEPLGIGGYGIAFTLLTMALFYFSTYFVFHFERSRNVTIASIVFVAIMEVFALIMANLCINAAPHLTSASFTMYANVPELITLLNAPWAVIVVLGVLVVAAIAACIFLTVRRFKSDKI